jgi:hypothetical protein
LFSRKESINGFNKHDVQQEIIQKEKRRNRPIRTGTRRNRNEK